MTVVTLDPVEIESINRAIDFIRSAGWKEKADRLKRCLDEHKINADLDMPRTHGAETSAGRGTINFNWLFNLCKGIPPQPLDRYDDRFVNLAAVLLHEADHLLGHGEIEAYGEQISFLEELNEHFQKYFPDATNDQKIDIELWKGYEERRLKALRKKYIENPDWEKK